MSTRRNAKYTPLDADGPLPVEMVRAVPAILRDPLTWLEGLVGRYGDAVALPMPRTPVLVVNEPGGARRVLQDNHRNYGKRTIQYGALAMVTGEGLLTADGPVWREHRRLVQPAFHRSSLDAVARHSLEAGRALRARLAAGGPDAPVDADAAALLATLDVVGRALFSDGLFAADRDAVGERVVHAVDDALHAVLARARSPLGAGPLRHLPTPARGRLRRALHVLDGVCADVVARRRARGVGPGDTDVLALMLRSGASDREVRDELVTMVIAGHETVASSVTWTLHLLAGAPDVQDAVHAELDQLGGRPGWGDLPYLRAVVAESLRLYPPAWVITRRAFGPDTVAGVPVPGGTLIILSPWLLHRRPDDYPDPLRFDPRRFAGEARPPASYLPFGAGPRLCIGRDLALVESVLMLATVLREHRAARPAGIADPVVDALVTLRPKGGLPLLLEPR